jgi:DNA-binding MarR family transcriptional regulator
VPRTLEANIKQVKPFKSLLEEAILNVVHTAADLEHQLAQQLKPFGITPTQYNVLRILRGAGADGLCRNEVGARLVRSVPDVTRLLDRMEEAGLIARERGSMDRRYVTTRLTRAGMDLVNTLDDDITRIHHEQLGHVDKRKLRTLVDLLTEIRSRE